MKTKIIPFISQEALQKRVQELGAYIARKHPKKEILLVAFDENETPFIQDLKQSIGERAKIASLNSRASVGYEPSENWCILLVHYLIESGERLEQVYKKYQDYQMFQRSESDDGSIFSVSLLQRMTSTEIIREPDYLGFSIPDECVVGYGMGIQGEYDSLPHIAIYDAS